MPFNKMTASSTPRRLWALVGFPGSGKSTFAARMRGPLLAIDADHRFDEVLSLAGDVYQLSTTPADNNDVERIAERLRANMPGSGVATIVVDSLTAIIAPLVVQAVLDNDAGRNKNRMAAFKDKALAMRLLQDAVSGWGTDCLWIYHLQHGRDANANEQVTATVSRTELARLTRSINLQLEIVDSGARRAIKVAWARRGRSGMTLVDDSGTWEGMPERIEQAVYGGLSLAEQDAIEQAIPTRFASAEQAIAWAVDSGAFGPADAPGALIHARNAYDKLKADKAPATASEMWALWIADVQERQHDPFDDLPSASREPAQAAALARNGNGATATLFDAAQLNAELDAQAEAEEKPLF